jgi:tetratricopeptide (TPR) repeat protein
MKIQLILISGIIVFACLFQSCTKQSENVQSKKDSIEKITGTMQTGSDDKSLTGIPGDSTDIYGTGNFNYHDSLDTYHRGYSIPRDSIYKVWNTKAFREYDELIKKHPLVPEPWLDRANHWQNIKMYPEAIKDYNRYIELYSRNPSAYMNRGNAHERLKEYDSAMNDYNMTLKLKPDDTIANFNKGNIYDIKGLYDSAVKQYDTVLMKDPKLAKGYYNRGTSYAALKNYQAAIKNWEEAVRLNPVYEPDLRPRINRLRVLVK